MKTKRICPKCKTEKPDDEFRHRDRGIKLNIPYGRCVRCRQTDYMIRQSDPINYFNSMLRNGRRSRAEISAKDLLALWKMQNGRCAITGLPMSMISGAGKRYNNVSIDRINAKLPYEHGNIWLVLSAVNAMKGSLSMTELVAFCRLISERDDLSLITR